VTNWVAVTGVALILGGVGIPFWFRREIFGVGGRRRAPRLPTPQPARARPEPAAGDTGWADCADRIAGWVRPEYRAFPVPIGAAPSGSEPYGWPVPVERPAE